MEYGFTTAAYVVAAVLIIQSLGGLSGQESAKRAVWYGIFGMALAILATLAGPGAGNWFVSLVMIGAGVRKDDEHFLVFERLINVVHEHAPKARLAFNTGPTDSAAAVQRWA